MSPDPASSRYRRRHRVPIVVVLVVLLVGAIVVWTQVLKPAPAAATGCNKPGPAPTRASSAGSTSSGTASGAGASGSGQGLRRAAASSTPATTSSTASSTPSTAASTTAGTASGTSSGASTPPTSQTPTSLGTFTDPNVLAAIRPADPSQIPLRVLNASIVTGQAKTVTDELRDAGFTAIEQQSNDPLYPASDLQCYGEIRFGWAGLAEARTVLIIAPCAQLVRDDRSDNSVDLSLGALYQVQPISKAIQTELTQIKNAAAPPPVIEGQTVSVRPVPTIPPLPSRAGCPG